MTRKKTDLSRGRQRAIRWFFRIILVLLVSTGGAHATSAPATGWVAVNSTNGVHRFQVEIMRTPQERSRGLMFRRHLESDHGMLFDFDRDTVIRMWMKNTYIPLDMVFIADDQTIVDIARDTVPLSLEVIPAGRPARYVLEVNAGTTARLSIQPGDRVEFGTD